MTSYRITVADTQADPTVYPFAFTSQVLSETISDGDRAHVRVTVTNRGDDAIEMYTGQPGVFPISGSEESDPGLILYHQGETPGRYVPQGHQQPTGYALGIGAIKRHELDPGMSESIMLDVLGDDPTDPPWRLPKGEFTFRADYAFGQCTDIEGRFEWGFSLIVETPS